MQDPDKWHRAVNELTGISEETTTGVHRLYQMMENARTTGSGYKCQ
jgi:adenosylhomocysteinase